MGRGEKAEMVEGGGKEEMEKGGKEKKTKECHLCCFQKEKIVVTLIGFL